MPDPTFTTRQTSTNWWMVVTKNGREELFPAGTELHARVMVGLAKERYERERDGLPPINRR